MNNYYDIIVVGAGPAGSIAARYAAEKGVSVLLLEKDPFPGSPVRCGEAADKKKITEFINPDPKWISAEINKFSFISPDGAEVVLNFKETGYILDRKIFDYELALMAVKAGAELITNAYVYALVFDNDCVSGVKVEIKDENFIIRGGIVIAADGVESRIGRFAGLETYTDFRDMESCVQVTVTGIKNLRKETCSLFFGKEVAPGGYLWVFPKGNSSANIGVGISGHSARQKSASRYLDNFLNRCYQDVTITKRIAGGVPCVPTLKKITAPGILLAGDSARQVNPLTGGGITSGMKAGSIAGRIAAESILNRKPELIINYEKEWHDSIGRKHEIYNNLKEGIYGFDDAKLNSIAYSFLKVPPAQRTLGKLFAAALVNNPSLLIDVAKVFIV